MGDALLAIDVGGSTSRAYLVDAEGRCLGCGRNRGGNPASTDPELAAAAIISAAEAALSDAAAGPPELAIALIALAGPQAHVARDRLEARFQALGLRGPLVFAGDLLAMFASATEAPDGYCAVAGTGAGVVRIRAGAIERVADAAGWLLGDRGSGFWLGLEAVRAVAAELEGRGETTALTPAVLAAFNVPWPNTRTRLGRPAALSLLIDAVYAQRPIELSRFAPLVVAHRSDPVAGQLVAEAGRYLVADFALAFDAQMPGPIALGGGLMPHLDGVPAGIAEVVRAAGHTPDLRPVADGSVGAVVLAMRAAGRAVDAAMFKTIANSVRTRSSRAVAG